jgi:hypothetical protein
MSGRREKLRVGAAAGTSTNGRPPRSASELPSLEPARSLSIRVYEIATHGTPINERERPLSLRTHP